MTGIILAHGAAQKIFDYNILTWSNWFTEIIVVCPEDDPIQRGGLKIYPYGKSEHSGYWCCERFRYACQIASTKKLACVLEYDTLLFGAHPSIENGKLKACGPMNDWPPYDFDATWYSHSPWVLSKKDFGRVSKYSANYKNSKYCDRWLAAVCQDLHIEPISVGNHYTPFAGYTDDYSEAIYQATSDQSINVFHGIKDVFAAHSIIFAKIDLQHLKNGV